MNIKGYYEIKCGSNVIRGTNLITLLGNSFFLNRMINNEFEPISHIVLGNSRIQAKTTDISLGNVTVKKKCVTEVNVGKKQIVLFASCTAKEILNTSEIGVLSGDILISHDIYEPITIELIGDNVDSVEITYIFDLSTYTNRSNWVKYTQINDGEDYNIYYVVEENNVMGVFEEDSASGYHSVHSLDEMKLKSGVYFYDITTKRVFIRTINEDNPNSYVISVIT